MKIEHFVKAIKGDAEFAPTVTELPDSRMSVVEYRTKRDYTRMMVLVSRDGRHRVVMVNNQFVDKESGPNTNYYVESVEHCVAEWRAINETKPEQDDEPPLLTRSDGTRYQVTPVRITRGGNGDKSTTHEVPDGYLDVPYPAEEVPFDDNVVVFVGKDLWHTPIVRLGDEHWSWDGVLWRHDNDAAHGAFASQLTEVFNDARTICQDNRELAR